MVGVATSTEGITVKKISYLPQQSMCKETTRGGEGEELTYLLKRCNVGVYLWQDWRADVMNSFSEVI